MRLPILVGFLIASFGSVAQVNPKYVRNYGPEINKSGEAIYAVAQNRAGLLFFATEKGVLAYDGGHWQMISIKDGIAIRSLEYDSARDRIWVGGVTTFGYLEESPVERYRYVCLSDSIFDQKPFKQIWQILFVESRVYFIANEAHYIWENEKIQVDIRLNTYVYQVGGLLYGSEKKGVCWVQSGNQTKVLWNQAAITRESIYQMVAKNDNEILFITPYNGVFIHDRSRQTVVPYREPLSQLLIDRPFYCSTMLSDSLIALGTWYDGIIITDLKGHVVDQFTEKNGLAANGVSDLEFDQHGKLWAATDYGISVINLKAARPWLKLFERSPDKPVITRVFIDHDSVVYNVASSAPLRFERKPASLQFEFANPGSDYMYTRQYYTKLDGFDSTWVSSTSSIKEYNQLPNGTFTFRVKDASAAEASYSFTIAEPWYATLVDARTPILTSVGVVALLIFTITYRLRSSKQLLTKMVAEKTREIEWREKELMLINQHLTQANEELDIFLYRSSHDLVAPVKSVKGLLNLMKLSKEETATYIPLMEDRILRLEKILTEINTYVRHAKRDPQEESFNVAQLIREIWGDLEFMEEASHIELQVKVDDTLELVADRGRWKTILSNLMANSIKYHDYRKSDLYIRVSAERKNGFWVEVEDNGQGIRKEYQGRIFEMFYRAHEDSTGIGLGLFMVKKIVEGLHGTITLTSTLGKGTTIQIHLP